jgi:subtilisin-like proprotein convertase family protein
VIDTGVDYNHPDLVANMWHNTLDPIDGVDNDGNGLVDDYYGADFANNDGNPMDDNNHGTHVSGTIGAVGNNGIGVVGVAWNVKIMALKFLSASGSGYTSDAIDCINYARTHGAKILNNSWGGGGYDSALFNAIVAAKNAGIIFVAAAGNNASNNDTTAAYPANYAVDNVVSVAAIDRNNNLASFSNYGATTVDLGAPGVSILSTTPNNTYSTFSGTSMATPHVSGALALVWAANPTLTYSQVIARVLNNVDPISSLSGKTVTGGRLNVFKAIGSTPPPDVTGPRVTSSVWSGAGNGVNSVQFTFSEAIASGSFTSADIVTFTGPGGTNLASQITGVSGSGTIWTVTFNNQTTVGSYNMTVGPDIVDLASPGNKMDQNSNGTNGEVPGDRYATSYSQSSGYTFTSTDVPKPINDLTTAVSVLSVNQNIIISDVNVKFYITHTWDADLRIRLRAPDNTLLTLVQYRGGSGDNFGSSTTYTTIDDEAGTAISAGTAPFTASYRPETNNQLSRLDFKNAFGTWKLEVYDSANLDTGMLRGWQLVITGSGGGVGGRSIGGEASTKVAVLDWVERARPLSFEVVAAATAPAAAENSERNAPAPTEQTVVNRVFAEATTTFTARRRHHSGGDPLGLWLDNQNDPLSV